MKKDEDNENDFRSKKILDIRVPYQVTYWAKELNVSRDMSDAQPKWRIIFPGALFTAVLFTLGKYLMGIYLTNFNIDSNYGAAGAMVLLLIWVFYSSQIIFFGAEFIHALASEHGYSLDPDAVRAHADKGMRHTHTLAEKP